MGSVSVAIVQTDDTSTGKLNVENIFRGTGHCQGLGGGGVGEASPYSQIAWW